MFPTKYNLLISKEIVIRFLTGINNLGNLQETGQPKDMFAMELLYNNVLPTVNNTGDEQFNGNIAAIKWNTPEFGVKAYGYGYDNINRLGRAKFAAGIALNADVNKYSVENITYDANGNILTLGRHNTTTSYIDNLEMTYNGNQLKKTYDSGDLVLGFVDMVDYETEYHYDLNGNMDVDDNKGFVFAYNYLNLPEEVVGGTDTVRYIYDATGIKMSKELVQGGAISYTNYVGNFVYKDGDLDYILTDEGRITQPTAGTFQYEYFLKDHLGNTRTVFADGNGDGLLADNEVLQENHYYPFGMSIGDLAVDRGADNKLKYNGKELQDDELGGVKLNYYDYGARFLDDFRWNVIDNKAEKYYSVSPYVYALNNPVRFIDPDGNVVVDATGNPITYSEKNGWSSNATADVKRIGNAMMQTRTGTAQFNRMSSASHPITLRISSATIVTSNPNGTKSYKLGNCQNSYDVNSATGEATVTKSEITIYEGTINQYMNDTQNSTSTEATAYQQNTTNNDERIAAVAGHESVHGTDETNQEQSVDNYLNGATNDVEAVPNAIEIQVLNETGDNNLQKLTAKQLEVKTPELELK